MHFVPYLYVCDELLTVRYRYIVLFGQKKNISLQLGLRQSRKQRDKERKKQRLLIYNRKESHRMKTTYCFLTIPTHRDETSKVNSIPPYSLASAIWFHGRSLDRLTTGSDVIILPELTRSANR